MTIHNQTHKYLSYHRGTAQRYGKSVEVLSATA